MSIEGYIFRTAELDRLRTAYMAATDIEDFEQSEAERTRIAREIHKLEKEMSADIRVTGRETNV